MDCENCEHLEAELARVKEAARIDLESAAWEIISLARRLKAAKAERKAQTANHARYGDAKQLFEWWKAQSGRNGRTKFTQARVEALCGALEEYSTREVAEAIRGCLWSDWHVQNGQTDLTLICRPDKIDSFMERFQSERLRRKRAFAQLPERIKPIDLFLSRLPSYTPSPSEAGTWAASCPLHDGLPSLFVRDADPIQFYCFNGCSADEILAAMKLTWEELDADGV